MINRKYEMILSFLLFMVIAGMMEALNFTYWKSLGEVADPIFGWAMAVMFLCGAIARFFIKPRNIIQHAVFASLIATSVFATFMSLGNIGRSLINVDVTAGKKELSTQAEIQRLEEKLKGAATNDEIELVERKIEEINASTGYLNSYKKPTKGSLLTITKNCVGGTPNSNWYLVNSEAGAKCQERQFLLSQLERLRSNARDDISKRISELKAQDAEDSEGKDAKAETVVSLLESVGVLMPKISEKDTSRENGLFWFQLALALVLELLAQTLKPSNLQSVAKKKRLPRIIRIYRLMARSKKTPAYKKQSLSKSAEIEQDESKAEVIPLEIAVQENKCSVPKHFSEVTDESLESYVDLPEGTKKGVRFVIINLMQMFAEDEKKKKVPEKKTSAEIALRSNRLPKLLKGLIPAEGVNHRHISEAKQILADNGYMLVERKKHGKVVRNYVEWKPYQAIEPIISRKLGLDRVVFMPNNRLKFNSLSQ